MKIKINCEFVNYLQENEVEVNLKATKHSEDLQKIIENIEKISNEVNSVIGIHNNEFYVLPIKEIVLFYTQEQKCYAKTEEGNFIIKKRLYELEEKLNQNKYIRISNSCIVNVEFIKSFDLSTIGNIIIKLKNGDIQYVSKRRIPSIMRFLKERWK